MSKNNSVLQVLCPFGEWAHARGMQLVDEISARRMRRNMRLTRAFVKIPVYMGHPDDKSGACKEKAVGKITDIIPVHDGIAVSVSYESEAFANFSAGSFPRMSPRWQMEKLPDGRYRPIRLISIGLTDNPNIPPSGRIISASCDTAEIYRAADAISVRADKCAASLESAKRCVSKAEKLGRRMKSARHRNSETPSGNISKNSGKSVREIAKIAKERSARTGESYTKIFASLKRSISSGV